VRWGVKEGRIRGDLSAMWTIFLACAISSIVEIGFARPNVGRQIRRPGRRKTSTSSSLCMHIVTGRFLSVGLDCGRRTDAVAYQAGRRADVFTACLLPTDRSLVRTSYVGDKYRTSGSRCDAVVPIAGCRAI